VKSERPTDSIDNLKQGEDGLEFENIDQITEDDMLQLTQI
jgi:hypothetical protein